MTEEFVTVATFQSLPEAIACQMHLESEGLTVFLADAETVRADWFLSNAIGSVKVQVLDSQAENAATLLERVRHQHDGQPQATDENVCLACGAVMPEEASACQACGWTYAGTEDLETDNTEI